MSETPEGTSAGTCKTCGAPVLWCRTAANLRWIPLDPEPHPDGNLTLTRGLAALVQPGASVPGPKYHSHFVTCPQATSHRKPRARKGD